ncbi:MAG: squalene/phytoene synthase family protein [Verrucomicrobiaceae bacterium]|nr:squalene/phytoene synthase family protein [Verrucomicrobiaceae bacterium]
MSSSQLSSAQIARKAKSNLAFALGCLSKERKRDMITFYAFCRVVDDIADDPATSEEDKERELNHWKTCVLEGTPPGHSVLDEALDLPKKYGFPRAWMAEIIEGVASDITKNRYETFEELLGYCYKVASVVGLVSIEIFGHEKPETRDYAINLGYALQLTNIIRDVGQDARETGRIYLPQEDLKQFNVSESDLLSGIPSEKLNKLLDFEYHRARDYYAAAQKALPQEDRKHMVASEIMAEIYSTILEKLKRRRYPIFEQRVKLLRVHKAWILGKHMLRAKFGRY